VATKYGRHRPGLALCLLIPAGVTAGCAYDYPEPVLTPQTGAAQTSKTAPVSSPDSSRAYSDPQILGLEARNYARLYELLRSVPGPVILFEVGPLDGPVRGFGTTAKVAEAGRYTVTAACIGASHAEISVGQENPGAPFRPMELNLDCTGATSEPITLEQGHVFAHLSLPAPGDTPWTGSVGGVRITK
jgi:hypothetical protein